MGVIYQLLFPSKKSYIGQTKKDPRKRWHLHRVRANKSWCVARAIAKYGWANVEKRILAVVPDDELDEQERSYIAKMKTLKPHGYNLTPGGDLNPMSLEKVRKHHLAQVQSDAHRLSQSEHTKAWHADEERHAAWRARNVAAHATDEFKKKRSEITKREWADPAVRQRRTQGLANAFASEEVARRRKDAAAVAVKTDAARANMVAGHQKAREARLALLSPVDRAKEERRLLMNREKTRRYLERKAAAAS